MKSYVIGDIHGCERELRYLIDGLPLDGGDRVVFLGDYIDRGHDSAGVLELLTSGVLPNCECRYLRGNHEQSLMAFLAAPGANRGWLLQGGAETLMSYGVQPPAFNSAEAVWHEAAEALRARMPSAHRAFLEGLERYVELGDYAFVHAGVDATVALEDQTDEALYWSRAAFIASKRPFSHRVVHGHTPVDEPYADARRIAVDTGAYASGTLTAARFEGEAVSFVSVRRPNPSVSAPLRPLAAVDW